MSVPYAEVIGDPIEHSKSPLIHGFWLEKLGLKGEYRRCHVRPDELADYFALRRADADWRGCNITIPHKVAALEFADRIDDAEIGATNCIYPDGDGLRAANTDVFGVIAAISHFDPPFCLIGNGGAARAAFAALDAVRDDQLRLLVRNPGKGAALVAAMAPMAGEVFGFDACTEAMAGCHGLINATSLGMTGQPELPSEILDAMALLAPDAVVFDMVYSPLRTPMLTRGEQLGLRCVDGLTMLIGQAAAAFEKFFGVAAPRELDAELRARLVA